MTWSARIAKEDGTFPVNTAGGEDYQACQTCKHGQYDEDTQQTPCRLPALSSCLGSLLTSVDVGSDGHMAPGEAILKCAGYEPNE